MGQKELLINLKTPVVIKKEGQEDKTYTSLTLRPFKAKHLRFLTSNILDMAGKTEKDLNENPGQAMKMASDMIPLIAGMTEVDEEVIGELDFKDLMEVVNSLTPFLAESLPTGENASGQ